MIALTLNAKDGVSRIQVFPMQIPSQNRNGEDIMIDNPTVKTLQEKGARMSNVQEIKAYVENHNRTLAEFKEAKIKLKGNPREMTLEGLATLLLNDLTVAADFTAPVLTTPEPEAPVVPPVMVPPEEDTTLLEQNLGKGGLKRLNEK